MNIEISHINDSDINIISDITRKTWEKTLNYMLTYDSLNYILNTYYSYRGITKKIMTNSYIYKKLIINNIIIGYISYLPLKNINKLRLCELLIVHNMQKQGLGTLLINYCCYIAASEGIKTVYLYVNTKNKAVKLYEDNGFYIIDEKNINIGNEVILNDYYMEKKLKM
jgi:ribosomal protein S18 acetylase RimI-like enzyme